MIMKTLNRGMQMVLLIFIGALLLSSCKKDSNNSNAQGMSTLKFRLTDAPGDYDAVYVDVQEVRVHVGDEDTTSTGSQGWYTLSNVQPGIYDLLDFQNGLDTLIAEDDVPSGNLSQIRLVLGSDNSVVIDSVSYPLKTPSAQQSGLKLNVHYTLEPGLIYKFYLDFDASKSIVEQGNGDYLLKPVIHVYTENTTGSIEGYVDPINVNATVLAYNASDSASTSSDTTGYFLIKGLAPGTYSVHFTPGTILYIPTTKSNINVTAGIVTDMDTIHF